MVFINLKKISIPKFVIKFQFRFIRFQLPVWRVSSSLDQENQQHNFPSG